MADNDKKKNATNPIYFKEAVHSDVSSGQGNQRNGDASPTRRSIDFYYGDWGCNMY